MTSRQKQLLAVVGASAVVLAVALFMMMRSGAEPPSPELARTASEPSEEHGPVVSRGKATPATGARRLEGMSAEVETSADEPGLTGKTKKNKKSRRKPRAEKPEPEEDSSGFQPVRRATLKKPERGP